MLISKEEMLAIAEELSFSYFGILNTEDLKFLPEVREMCASGRCNMYGKRWSCPPACGTLEEITEKARAYSYGIVLQMTGQMEDDFDVETIMDTEQKLKERFGLMADVLREKEVEFLPMSAGTCTLCKECTYPDAPCRFPEKVSPSMEAYGLVVSDCCKAAGIEYYYGPQTMTFSACILF
jgi:predicted metal-binding protein